MITTKDYLKNHLRAENCNHITIRPHINYTYLNFTELSYSGKS